MSMRNLLLLLSYSSSSSAQRCCVITRCVNLKQVSNSCQLVHQCTQTRMLIVNSSQRRLKVGDQVTDRQAGWERSRRRRRRRLVARREGADGARPKRRDRIAGTAVGGDAAGRDDVGARPSLAVRPPRGLGGGDGDGDAAARHRHGRPARRHAATAAASNDADRRHRRIERRREYWHAEPVSGTCG